MPNHVKNRITLIGSEESIKSLVEKFSTTYPETEDTAYDGRVICTNQSGSIGWYDKESTVFERRNETSVLGLPDGFKFEMQKEWTRFPDFEKVFPVPECIKLVGDSVSSNIVDAVKAKYRHPFSNNPLLAFLESSSRLKNENKISPEDQMQFELACKAYEETGFCYWYDYNIDKWGTKWNAYSCEKLSDNVYDFDTAWSRVLDIIIEISKSFDGQIAYAYSDEDTGHNVGSFLIASGIVISDFVPSGGTTPAYELAFELRPESKEYYKLIDGEYVYTDDED